MTRATVIRYSTTPQTAEENSRLVRAVYAALGESRPDGLRYATFRLADGVSFVHVALHDAAANPLAELPAFQEFQRGLAARVVAPPDAIAATVLGSYRLM
jgi:hypothetical protein